jgi:Fe(3+) dicitrate transport protein
LNGASGQETLTELIPSLGATYEFSAATAFAGIHRGFSPPSTADLIDNSGTSVDLDAEQSWNTELGLRSRPLPGVTLEATAFRNDFQRQITVGSIAGGSTPLATGEALYQGLELAGRTDFGRFFDGVHNPFIELAYTWLPTAEQSTTLTQVVGGAPVSGSAPGNRMPYAPRNTVTASLGYSHPVGMDLRLESVFVDQQFSNFANTVNAPANGNGQAGEIGSFMVWNAAVNYRFLRSGLGLFVTAKNLFDKVYIVDRIRGILPGAPRLVQAGVEYQF